MNFIKEELITDLSLEEIYKISDELYQKAKIEFDAAKKDADTQYPHCRLAPWGKEVEGAE
tara:strand:+ start:542 stop:721 length:180 start_codon:yes stop_codon:yes gene_type:complete